MEKVIKVDDCIDNFGIHNASIVSQTTTNGDIIEAMFNPYKICKYEFNVRIYMTERDFEESDYQMNFDRRWWNAPYKAESEE